MLRGWTKALRRGDLAKLNEVQLHGDFLTRVFGDVLGYVTSTANRDDSKYQLRPEYSFGASRKAADGGLGFFGTDGDHLVAPIELKGANQGLDTRKGRVQTPVEQAWGYASRAPESKWIIVSNYDETRLYAKSRGWDVYEVFKLEDLDGEHEFLRFYALLNPGTLLGSAPGAKSPLDTILEGSAVVQQQVTDALYAMYREVRRELFTDLRRKHSNRPALELLPMAQTILDRVIFCAFAEDRLLIPAGTIGRALDAQNAYDKNWSKWRSLCGVFRGLDEGSQILGLPPLNGGLFRPDEEIDELEVSDEICERFREIANYDFADDVTVEVLGHIFEQSVTDLEELRADAVEQEFVNTQKKPSKRRAEGVFYTPGFVTRYLVDLTLGEAFREREEAAFSAVYGKGVRTSKARDLEAWEAYRESLRSLRVLDPACGSGAFLIAAFEALEREYDRVNRALARLRDGQIEVFDLTTSVLNENLFGIDLNGESVEITKLSLWLKTARKDKKLTYLDRNVRRGNSVVDNPLVDPFAFDWRAGRTAQTFLEVPGKGVDLKKVEAIDARWKEGFDVVIGNPPYVRHELLGAYKEHWKTSFHCYDGMADLYVYFFERGLSVLKPGGRLGFIVSNKWLRAGYAERLRLYLATQTEVERIVDFGHAPIFRDADAFPCILSTRRLDKGSHPDVNHEVQVTQFPREELHKAEVPAYVAQNSTPVVQKKFSGGPWALETSGADALFETMRSVGTPLREHAGCRPMYGIKTGYNAAYVVDTQKRDELVAKDHKCGRLISRFLRGQDLSRWSADWGGYWMIKLSSSGDTAWPWAGSDEEKAESEFAAEFPSLHEHFKEFEDRLRKRSDQGRFWWELRSCAYYDLFEAPKITFPDIIWRADFALDTDAALANNTTYFLPTGDKWLLAVLNSPLMWSYMWNNAQHGKDEALRMFGEFVEGLPIAVPDDEQRRAAEELVTVLTTLKVKFVEGREAILDMLRLQYAVSKPGNALSELVSLGVDEFIKEILKRMPSKKRGEPKLSTAGQRELRKVFDAEVVPLKEAVSVMRAKERALSHIVNRAYGLTPDDENLLWETAPPRMPDAR